MRSGLNFIKSLLGIETKNNSSSKNKESLNFIKSLLGIETRFEGNTTITPAGLNFIKSLLGIETKQNVV